MQTGACGRQIGVVVMTKPTFHPGQAVPTSGQYVAVVPRGAPRREITCVAGKPFPPTRPGEAGFRLVDATRH